MKFKANEHRSLHPRQRLRPRLPTALSCGGCCTRQNWSVCVFTAASVSRFTASSPHPMFKDAPHHCHCIVEPPSRLIATCVSVCVCNLQVISANSERCIRVHGQFLFPSCVSMHVAFASVHRGAPAVATAVAPVHRDVCNRFSSW